MRTTGTRLRLAALFLPLVTFATAATAAPSFMHLGSRTTQPVGHYEFCQRNPGECKQATKKAPVELTRKLWGAMVDINNAVNVMTTPRTDLEMWGREEFWSYPDGVGDCEDYVLEKRRELIKAGVPSANLLITVVKQRNGLGHAVLTVRTSHGDFILDNLEPRILSWDETDYTFLKQQSSRNAGVWVAIDDDRNIAVGSVKQ